MKKAHFVLAVALLCPNPALAATVLTPPITSTPCTKINLPDGSIACAPKLSQRFNAAPRLVKLGDTIRTPEISFAKKLCHKWGGTHLLPVPDENKAWDCFKVIIVPVVRSTSR